MTRSRVRARSRMFVVVGMTLVAFAALPALAHAAASWQSGPLVESQDTNCITGDVEQEAGSYLSYYADPASPPQVGQVYYVAIDLTGIGNTCPGIYADVNLIMPSGTAPAVSAQFPVRCYLQFPGHSNYVQDTGSECPQSLPLGPHGYSLDPQGVNPPFWPLPQGASVEIQVPVVSTQALNGTSQLHGYVQLADGEFDPTLTPSLVTIVNPQNTPVAQQIGVVYQTPSISSQQQPVANGPVSANFTGFVQNNSNPGTAVAELAKADAAGDCSNPASIFTSNTATLHAPNTSITGTFTGLYPGGAYCWRIKATVTSGPQAGEYDGNWEYFTTIGTYLTGQTGQFVPPAAKPTQVSQCSTNGSGCATSNCNAGSTCTGGGTLGSFSGGKTTTDRTLTVSVAGSGSGTVSGTGGLACPGACSKVYTSGTAVSLTASPAAGSVFKGWSGACSGTGACSVTMGADQTVTATFDPAPKPVVAAPKCTLTPGGSGVLLKAHKRSQRTSVGLVRFGVRCDQAVTIALSAVVTETIGHRHGKPVVGLFRLGPVRSSVRAGVATTFSLRLSAGALAALSHHKPESLAAALVGSDANGTARASATLAKLHGVS